MSGPTTAEVTKRFDSLNRARVSSRINCEEFAEYVSLRTVALPIAEHRDAAVAERDALAAEVARLREALEKRYAAGHNDTCAAMLGDYACSCGHDGLLEATAKGAGR